MEICPNCGKEVNPIEHLTLGHAIPVSQIECSCGYVGLPVEYEEDPK